MEHLGHGLDRNPVAFVEVCQGHQDHPLRAADSKSFCPEMPEFLQVDVDRSDLPGESSGQVLIPLGALRGIGVFRQDLWSHLRFLFFDAALRTPFFTIFAAMQIAKI